MSFSYRRLLHTVTLLFTVLGYGGRSDGCYTVPNIQAYSLDSSTSACIVKPHALPMVDCFGRYSNALLYETRLFLIGLPYRNVIYKS
jgi:hypothetical protein